MAKVKTKGSTGNAKNFITRTQAVRKLQISLADFRRICIFKGVYPREPRNKKKANKGSTALTTFYYTKDIQYLLHEPVLQKFREHKTFAKKLQKALGRGDYGDAQRLELNQKPQVTLDHLVKERYPSFTDALRDLDDALSMLFLFANLPTNHNLPVATLAGCQRLCNEWQHLVIRAQILKKSFLSIKGIYYQAEIQGQDIIWLVPYKFAQNMPTDVDFRIMHTFIEFYTTLLGFVLLKLYTNEGLVYPPKFDEEADTRGAGLCAFQLENQSVDQALGTSAVDKTQQKIFRKRLATLGDTLSKLTNTEHKIESDENESEPLKDEMDIFDPITTDFAIDILPQSNSTKNLIRETDSSNLFSTFTVYLSRETPREPLEFILRSFGCKRIGWDAILGDGAFTSSELDSLITHQIIDRPPVATDRQTDHITKIISKNNRRIPGRIYIQPQYIWDCINAGQLISPAEYAPGVILPPHLSPWIKVTSYGYDPTAPLEVDDRSETEVEVEDLENGIIENLDTGEQDIEMGGIISVLVEEDEDETFRQQHHKELEAEVAGVTLLDNAKKKSKKCKQQQEEHEQKEMQKIMMTKKKRKLYEKMIHSNKKKGDETERLKQKRRNFNQANMNISA